MTTDMKIKVTAETEGIDEATDEIHELSDALMEFPPNVMIKNCNYCTFNIHPSQTQFVESKFEDEPETNANQRTQRTQRVERSDEPQTDCAWGRENQPRTVPLYPVKGGGE